MKMCRLFILLFTLLPCQAAFVMPLLLHIAAALQLTKLH